MYITEELFNNERTISGHIIVIENVFWNYFIIGKHLLEYILLCENITFYKID